MNSSEPPKGTRALQDDGPESDPANTALQRQLDRLARVDRHDIQSAKTDVSPRDLAWARQALKQVTQARTPRRPRLIFGFCLAAAALFLMLFALRFQKSKSLEQQDNAFLGERATGPELQLESGVGLDLPGELAGGDFMRLAFFGYENGAELGVNPLLLNTEPWFPDPSLLQSLPATGFLEVSIERASGVNEPPVYCYFWQAPR